MNSDGTYTAVNTDTTLIIFVLRKNLMLIMFRWSRDASIPPPEITEFPELLPRPSPTRRLFWTNPTNLQNKLAAGVLTIARTEVCFLDNDNNGTCLRCFWG